MGTWRAGGERFAGPTVGIFSRRRPRLCRRRCMEGGYITIPFANTRLVGTAPVSQSRGVSVNFLCPVLVSIVFIRSRPYASALRHAHGWHMSHARTHTSSLCKDRLLRHMLLLVRMTFLALVISLALGKDAWLMCSSFATEV